MSTLCLITQYLYPILITKTTCVALSLPEINSSHPSLAFKKTQSSSVIFFSFIIFPLLYCYFPRLHHISPSLLLFSSASSYFPFFTVIFIVFIIFPLLYSYFPRLHHMFPSLQLFSSALLSLILSRSFLCFIDIKLSLLCLTPAHSAPFPKPTTHRHTHRGTPFLSSPWGYRPRIRKCKRPGLQVGGLGRRPVEVIEEESCQINRK